MLLCHLCFSSTLTVQPTHALVFATVLYLTFLAHVCDPFLFRRHFCKKKMWKKSFTAFVQVFVKGRAPKMGLSADEKLFPPKEKREESFFCVDAKKMESSNFLFAHENCSV